MPKKENPDNIDINALPAEQRAALYNSRIRSRDRMLELVVDAAETYAAELLRSDNAHAARLSKQKTYFERIISETARELDNHKFTLLDLQMAIEDVEREIQEKKEQERQAQEDLRRMFEDGRIVDINKARNARDED